MDFTTNGFDWVVNLRQKLEAVCIEVEDKICQEAKHLESHVQTFYADVIQDLLPSSCTSPVQEKVSGSPVVKNSDDVNEDQIKGKPSHEESGVIAPVGQDCRQTADSTEDCDIRDENNIFLPPSDVNLVSKDSEKNLEDNDNLETSKLAIENDHSVKNEKYAPHPSEVVLPVSNQASLSSSPRNTKCLQPQTSLGGVPLYTHKDNEILIYKQVKIDQEEKALTMEPSSEASTLLCSSRDCNASPLFSEIRDEDRNRVCVPLPTSASTEVIDRQYSQVSGLCRDNVVDAVECIADVSSSSQPCDLDHPVVLFPTESEGNYYYNFFLSFS
ncbi:hypothetical protein FRX31_034998 [Thalictrum thalictroides]|uniref:Uncharacterized protein n=1 Tax=Thalictrum thalictroides TaxID=46969 RepID=A0A7J6USA5_THATH|nr:hypothetical protein FRX31_034998 [Thalictrum thalictroides]